MANIKSAQKRIKVIEAKNRRNRIVKSSMRSLLKKFETTLAQGDAKAAEEMFPSVVSSLNTAASKGVLHKNTANRKISRLNLRLNSAVK
jgi:small subunit ribosomal protein S20